MMSRETAHNTGNTLSTQEGGAGAVMELLLLQSSELSHSVPSSPVGNRVYGKLVWAIQSTSGNVMLE